MKSKFIKVKKINYLIGLLVQLLCFIVFLLIEIKKENNLSAFLCLAINIFIISEMVLIVRGKNDISEEKTIKEKINQEDK